MLMRRGWPYRWQTTSSNRWIIPGWRHRYAVLHLCVLVTLSRVYVEIIFRCRSSSLFPLRFCRWRSCLRGRRPSSSSSSSRTGTKHFTGSVWQSLHSRKKLHIWKQTASRTKYASFFICIDLSVYICKVTSWWSTTRLDLDQNQRCDATFINANRCFLLRLLR